jgi:hypothetical protein
MASLRLRPARGHGPTGRTGQRVGATLFFGLFLAGGVFFGVMLGQEMAERLAPHGWAKAAATIERAEVVRRDGEEPYVPVVAFRYQWNGETRAGDTLAPGDLGHGDYGSAAARLAPYPVGTTVPCRVTPDGRAVLEPGRVLPFALFGALPLLFVLIGAAGIHAAWRPRRTDASGRPVEEPISATAGRGRGARAMAWIGGPIAVLGAGLLWPMAISPGLSIVRAQGWSPTTCVVEHSSVRAHHSDDGTTYSVDILYRYERDGRAWRSSRYGFFGGSSGGRSGKEAIVRAHPVGASVPCWVDPSDPAEAVLERGPTVHALVAVVPVGLLALGLTFVVLARRRGRLRDRPGTASGRGPGPDDPVLEWLPPFDATPGETRLAPESTRLARLVGIVFACVFWNGIVSVFVHQVVGSFERGRPSWGLALFLVPFVLVGAGLCAGVVHAVMGLSNARPELSASAKALRLGETLELGWRLRGRLAGLRRLTLTLEGREKATYRRGTNSYTATEVFFSQPLVDLVAPIPVAVGRATVELPRDTMHSFEGGHNAIEWALCLKGEIDRWPDIGERYAIVVLPLAPGERVEPKDPTEVRA